MGDQNLHSRLTHSYWKMITTCGSFPLRDMSEGSLSVHSSNSSYLDLANSSVAGAGMGAELFE
jgi:hypothetical protein